ncbi:MAG: N-6 DNA methylase [Candidatus Thermoplasmatota archaeon]|nr:N-6 DNA methylase [Candidatus Thermoplasmatota archaeon]
MGSNSSGINLDRIKSLVEKYEDLKRTGKLKTKNETDTRDEFISPFFKALGWNMENDPNRNDEVTKEENIAGKRSDYGFKINGIHKFILEAKSIKEEHIAFNTGYDRQAVTYAWNKSSSWAVLTNFRTLTVYNADSGSPVLTFNLYAEDFLSENGIEKLNWLSKSGFEAGLLDKWAEDNGRIPMKRPVDKQLLQDMIHFREILSRDIKKNNPKVAQDDLDEIVQRILDRLVFIRNAEDREYEPKELKSNFRQWSVKEHGHLIKRVRELYQHYREVYNSGLFGKNSDLLHISDQVDISNEVLKEVIQGLYSPESANYSYDFSVLNTDVLGKIYEQYLENMLKQTPKRAKLESSKTHRKEQGIYYTPSYIVDYIVKNTVGEYIKTHTPEEIRNVKILDPSCGSGSFLIKAYQELEKYWKGKYGDQETLKYDEEGGFYSTKVEILKNNIFGVDLDPKAVEIAQLNLLLQISERKQKLPVIQNNIKIGNSLIDDLNVSERAFNWEEQFPEIMKNGGFDVVIGNPPYIRMQYLDEKESSFFNSHFKSATKNYDIYVLFVEKSLKFLSRNGVLGFILPSKFVNADYGIGIRNIISNSKSLYRIVDFKDFQVFGTATNYTCLLFLKNSENERFIYQYPRDRNSFSLSQLSNKDALERVKMEPPIQNSAWVMSDKNSISVLKKIDSRGIKLGVLTKNIFQGIITGADSIFFVEMTGKSGATVNVRNIKDGNDFELERRILKKLLKGKNIRKWSAEWEGYYVVYPYKVENGKARLIPISELETEYPLTYTYFKHYENELKSREEDRFRNETNWHQFGRLQNIEKFEQVKIMTQVLASHNTFAIDEDLDYYFVGGGNAGGYGIVLKDEYKDLYYYVLALLNSKVLEFYLKNISTPFRGGYFSYGKRFIEQLPVILSSNDRNGEINRLSRRIVEMRKMVEINGNKKTDEINRIMDEIETETNKLDNEIYVLYRLTSKEVNNIESFLNGN